MTPDALDAIRKRDAEWHDILDSPFSDLLEQEQALRDRRALLAEVDRLRLELYAANVHLGAEQARLARIRAAVAGLSDSLHGGDARAIVERMLP